MADSKARPGGAKLIVFLAEGFGVGRIRFAPGTWGTLVGVLWIWFLILPGNVWFYAAGMVGGFFVSVFVGGRAEKILGEKDPGRIVIDEITAMPLAYLGVVIGQGRVDWPHHFEAKQLMLMAGVFVLFRVFDILKPLGIAGTQRLPGGWGLTVDDFAAAAVAGLIISVPAGVWR